MLYTLCRTCRLKRNSDERKTYPPVENKKCSKCGEVKGKEEFTILKHNTTGLCPWCKECKNSANLREEVRAKARQDKLLRKYGMTPDDYQDMFDRQGGRCAICGSMDNGSSQASNFFIDHCHKTNVVRGLLCHGCNVALGHFKDDPEIVARAVEYLEENQ